MEMRVSGSPDIWAAPGRPGWKCQDGNAGIHLQTRRPVRVPGLSSVVCAVRIVSFPPIWGLARLRGGFTGSACGSGPGGGVFLSPCHRPGRRGHGGHGDTGDTGTLLSSKRQTDPRSRGIARFCFLCFPSEPASEFPCVFPSPAGGDASAPAVGVRQVPQALQPPGLLAPRRVRNLIPPEGPRFPR